MLDFEWFWDGVSLILVGFWHPGPFKIRAWCRRGATFQKFAFSLTMFVFRMILG